MSPAGSTGVITGCRYMMLMTVVVLYDVGFCGLASVQELTPRVLRTRMAKSAVYPLCRLWSDTEFCANSGRFRHTCMA